jgi:hypothetical protein
MAIPSGLCSAAKLHRSDNNSQRGTARTGFTLHRGLRGSDGKGMIGCIIFLVLIGTAIFLAIRLVPLYYSNQNFKSDVEAEVSRAAAKSLQNEIIVDNILATAKMYDIELTQEDIKVDRFAGQVHVAVNYTVPVNFALFRRGLKFHIEVSSFVGTR